MWLTLTVTHSGAGLTANRDNRPSPPLVHQDSARELDNYSDLETGGHKTLLQCLHGSFYPLKGFI